MARIWRRRRLPPWSLSCKRCVRPMCLSRATPPFPRLLAVEPWIIIPLLLAGAVYLRGWWQLHRRLPRRFSVWRLIAFQAGLLTLFLALASPLHALAEQLLQFHMIQHLLLMMVVPPLLWL